MIFRFMVQIYKKLQYLVTMSEKYLPIICIVSDYLNVKT